MRKKVIEMIENFIIEVMRQTKIPGLSIAIVKDGNLEYANGFGAKCLDGNLPMTADTLIGIGSISKSFTALAIMQLVEQGKIDLREPVNNYIDFKLGSKKKSNKNTPPAFSFIWLSGSRCYIYSNSPRSWFIGNNNPYE